MAAWLKEEEARLERSLLSDCEKLAQVRLEKQRSEGLARELDGILARIALLQRKTISAEIARGSRARVEIDDSALQHVDAGGRIEESAGNSKVQVATRMPLPASATAQPEKVDTSFMIDCWESCVAANKQTTGESAARRALANDKLQGGRALADSERKICDVLAAYLKTHKGNQGVDLRTVGTWLSICPTKTEVGEFFEREYCNAAGNEAEELKIMYKVVKAQHRTLSRFITASGLFVIKNCPDNEQQPRVHLNDLPSAGDCLPQQSAEAWALAGGRTKSPEPRLQEISAETAPDADIAEVEQAPHRIISLKESDIPTVASTVLMNHEPAKETQQRGARVAVGSDKWSPLAADVSLKFAVDMNALPIDPEGCGLARVDESKLLFQVKVEEVEPISREIWHKPKRPPSAGAGTRGGGSKQFWLKVRGVREGINHVYLRLGIQSEAAQKTTAVGKESKMRSVIWGAFNRHPLGLNVKFSNGGCAVTLVQGLDGPHGGTTCQHDDRSAEKEMNPTGAAESARGSIDEEDSLDCRAYTSPVAAAVTGKRKFTVAATPAAKAPRGKPAKKCNISPRSHSACGRPSTRSQNKA